MDSKQMKVLRQVVDITRDKMTTTPVALSQIVDLPLKEVRLALTDLLNKGMVKRYSGSAVYAAAPRGIRLIDSEDAKVAPPLNLA